MTATASRSPRFRSNLPCPNCDVPLNVINTRLYSTRVRLRRRVCPECDYVEPSIEIPLPSHWGDLIRFRDGLLSIEKPFRALITAQPVVAAQLLHEGRLEGVCPECGASRPKGHRNPLCERCNRRTPEYKRQRAAQALRYRLRQQEKLGVSTPQQQTVVCGSCRFGGSLQRCDFDFPEAFTNGAADCSNYSPETP